LKNRHRLGIGKFDEPSLAGPSFSRICQASIADTHYLGLDDGANAEIVKTVLVPLLHGMMDFLS
jgi:hypothetical protein